MIQESLVTNCDV